MAMDTFLLWVNVDKEEIDSLEAFVDAAKSAGKEWKMGGTGSGQEDSILTAMLETEFDLDMTYIPFEGGGTVAKNLVGNHVDSTVNNPAEQNEFWRAGNTKPLVQFTEERMEAYPDVPTAKELGHDVEYYMQRSINGPPGMPKEAQDWYSQLFQTLFESDEWQAYCQSEGLFCEEWMAGEDLGAFHQTQYERHKALIEKVGATAITGE
jgi:tripartite-type tricarboxylate transporter receptor subunit TctC